MKINIRAAGAMAQARLRAQQSARGITQAVRARFPVPSVAPQHVLAPAPPPAPPPAAVTLPLAPNVAVPATPRSAITEDDLRASRDLMADQMEAAGQVEPTELTTAPGVKTGALAAGQKKGGAAGPIAGGIAGFLVAGPIGAVAGLIAGSLLGKKGVTGPVSIKSAVPLVPASGSAPSPLIMPKGLPGEPTVTPSTQEQVVEALRKAPV